MDELDERIPVHCRSPSSASHERGRRGQYGSGRRSDAWRRRNCAPIGASRSDADFALQRLHLGRDETGGPSSAITQTHGLSPAATGLWVPRSPRSETSPTPHMSARRPQRPAEHQGQLAADMRMLGISRPGAARRKRMLASAARPAKANRQSSAPGMTARQAIASSRRRRAGTVDREAPAVGASAGAAADLGGTAGADAAQRPFDRIASISVRRRSPS